MSVRLVPRQLALLVGLVVVLAAGRASAYPQFQLSRDQTCSGCHLSPAGGGLLTENGLATAEAMSMLGTAPEFMYDAIPLPDWLRLGGDVRGNFGYLRAPQQYFVAFPMQADLYASAGAKGFRLQVTAGYRPARYGNEGVTHVWSREHYLEWAQQGEGATEGLFVRVGRFMPVFGLRFAEHPIYTRRYGGTPLYGETYGAAVEYVTSKIEGHLTGFIKDPLIDSVVHDSGGAAYAEMRLTEQFLLGAEGMVTKSANDSKYRGGVTAKYYLPGPDLLFQGELQVVNQHIGSFGLTQLVSYVMGTWYGPAGTMFDLGYGHYDENLGVKALDQDSVDLNVHWFLTSHFEGVLNSHVEVIGKGDGGPTGAWVLAQLHYRL